MICLYFKTPQVNNEYSFQNICCVEIYINFLSFQILEAMQRHVEKQKKRSNNRNKIAGENTGMAKFKNDKEISNKKYCITSRFQKKYSEKEH